MVKYTMAKIDENGKTYTIHYYLPESFVDDNNITWRLQTEIAMYSTIYANGTKDFMDITDAIAYLNLDVAEK